MQAIPILVAVKDLLVDRALGYLMELAQLPLSLIPFGMRRGYFLHSNDSNLGERFVLLSESCVQETRSSFVFFNSPSREVDLF